ncbi:GL18063, partial [Drosophila persimilis]
PPADVNVNESPVHLTLCDTAGQDTLDPLRELCYPDSDVFLLCFSVVKPETFRAIKSKWAPKFAKAKAALILVGTQADLRGNQSVLNKLQTNGEKAISYADAWDLATTIGAKYIETSSATQGSYPIGYVYIYSFEEYHNFGQPFANHKVNLSPYRAFVFVLLSRQSRPYFRFCLRS